MIRTALAASILALVCACSSASSQQAAALPQATRDLPPAACAAAGGAITKVCRRQVERCVMPFKDAGKRCTDGDQCAGDCLFEGPEVKPGEPLVGVCQKNDDPCGCFSPLEDGKLSDMARCVD